MLELSSEVHSIGETIFTAGTIKSRGNKTYWGIPIEQQQQLLRPREPPIQRKLYCIINNNLFQSFELSTQLGSRVWKDKSKGYISSPDFLRSLLTSSNYEPLNHKFYSSLAESNHCGIKHCKEGSSNKSIKNR